MFHVSLFIKTMIDHFEPISPLAHLLEAKANALALIDTGIKVDAVIAELDRQIADALKACTTTDRAGTKGID